LARWCCAQRNTSAIFWWVPVLGPCARLEGIESARVDQWLWSVRMTTTRSDAAAACRGGHVKVNRKEAKPAKPDKDGERVED